MGFARTIWILLASCLALGVPAGAQDSPNTDSRNADSWTTEAMRGPGLEQRRFQSARIQADVSLHVYRPPSYEREQARRYPVLYWLHGSGGGLDGIPFLARRFDNAIRAGKLPEIIVVIPWGLAEGMWCDSKDGRTPVESVLLGEVLPFVDAEYRTIAKPQARILEGFSMGGYGAGRLGFRNPQLFGAISMLGAGPLHPDFQVRRAGPASRDALLKRVYGDDLEYYRALSPWRLAEQYRDSLRRIPLRIAIGSRDETLEFNQSFHEHLEKLGIPHEYKVHEGVAHKPMALLEAMGDEYWAFHREFLERPAAPAPITLKPVLEPLLKQHGFPALGACVVSGGRVLAVGAVGERELGSGIAVTADDLWHLGSCTKAVTATLAARLVEQGRIRWDSDASVLLAASGLEIQPEWKGATLSLLLSNRGGAPGAAPKDLWSLAWECKGTPTEQRRLFVEGLLTRKPEAQPGTKNIYSNQGFAIAGHMLERATGRSWEELMRAEVFGPLGMYEVGFGAPGSINRIDQPRGHNPKPVPPGPAADNPPAIGPAGTMHASLGSWALFIAEHIRGANGKSDYLRPESWKLLQSDAHEQDYAMGWGVAKREWAGGVCLSHSGSNTMWYSLVWVAPNKDLAFLVTTNIAGDGAPKACDAVVQALLAWKTEMDRK